MVVGGFAINRLGFVRATEDIGLMTGACGVRYEDASGVIETEVIDGVPIPFAGAQTMLRMKQSPRKKCR